MFSKLKFTNLVFYSNVFDFYVYLLNNILFLYILIYIVIRANRTIIIVVYVTKYIPLPYE